jgi:hypothetical protein
MMAIALEKAVLVSIFVESIFYGLFLFLFLLSASVIWSRHRESPSSRSINTKLFCVLLAMFIVASINLGASFARVLDAFLIGANPELTTQKLSAIDTPIYLLRAILYGIQTLIGDVFILYRLHLVWNGNKFVFYPLLTGFLGSVVTALGSFTSAAHSHLSSSSTTLPILTFKQNGWVISFFVLTLLINGFATALIAGRIWWVPLRVTQIQGSNGNLGPTSIAIMESGAIYSISLVILMVLYVKHTYAQNIVLDSMTQIIGIAFSLVIVRVALGLARAGAIKPQSMQIQQLNFSMQSMMERHNTMAQHREDSLKSGDSPTLKNAQSDFITCAVEVVQARDTDSLDIDPPLGESKEEHSQHRADTPYSSRRI